MEKRWKVDEPQTAILGPGEVTEDSLAAVPQRFAERVVLAAPRGGQNRLRCETQGIPVAAAREQWRPSR